MKKILFIVSFALSSLQVIVGQIIIANTYIVNTDIYDTIQGGYISGQVTFNPETRTLTLEDATIFERSPEEFEISDGVLVFSGTHTNRLDTINIKLLGDNVLIAKSSLGCGITGYYCTQINILGPGSLVVRGFPGISLDYVQGLTIREGATVRFPQTVVPGVEYVGVVSHHERTPVLIDSSTFICEKGIPFRNIADLQLSCCHISVPVNACFDEPTGTILNADNTSVSGYFEILPGAGTAVLQYLKKKINLSIWPNPVDDMINVVMIGNENINNVVVYDLQGRAVETLRATSLQDGTATLDVKSLPAGVYVLRVKDADGREYQQKVVKK